MTEHPTVGEPVAANGRGFLTYAGSPIKTSYGHTIRVQESSAASEPHVWLFIGDSPAASGRNPHLNLEQAIALRAALDQFIEGVPNRWSNGQAMLDEAKRAIFGNHDKEG
ncbi:hypothetical protein ACFYM2_21035 [Streptomyces sp. NPDC006711]|uniref:hypothetical protein n=1 Tax=Streptomyces sp. NPDC006711 TaxID=3364762 RepID=UPI00368BE875